MESVVADARPRESEAEVFGQPIGLYVCFATELWERFSFYGMKYLLVLYLTRYHLFNDAASLDVLGAYAGLVYALPVIGGLLADRYLGMRKAVVLGGILLSLGHILMAVEGHQAIHYAAGTVLASDLRLVDGTVLAAGTTLLEDVTIRDTAALKVFYLALALIVTGVGYLKPNISTIVGKLYAEDDPRRDGGFTIFYMGINIGSFVATLLCGYLGETYGWKYGFGLAGIGMILGLITFLWGQRYLFGHADPPDEAVLRERMFGFISRENLIYLLTVPAIFLVWLLVQHEPVVFLTQNIFLVLAIVGIILYSMLYHDRNPKRSVVYGFTAATLVLGTLAAVAGSGILVEAAENWPALEGLAHWLDSTKEYVVYAVVISVVAFVVLGFVRHGSHEYSRTVVLMILIVSTIVFWALFEQSAGSMTFYADRVVDRDIFSYTVSSSSAMPFRIAGGLIALLAAAGVVYGVRHALPHGASVPVLIGAFVAALVLPMLPAIVGFAFLFLGFLYYREKGGHQVTSNEATLMGGSAVAVGTTVFAIGVYMVYLGNTYASLAEPRLVNFTPTASNFGSLNAGFIMILAIPFAILWTWMAKRNIEPSTPVKFSLGIIQAGLGFGALVLGAQFPDAAGKVAAIWLVLAYLLHTTGELCLSPVGLSAVTKLSIPRVVGISMGTWFLATALSETVATRIGRMAAIDTSAGEISDVGTALATYTELFQFLMYFGVGSGLLLLLISPFLKRGMHGIH